MKEIVKWQTTTGKKVEVTAELILTETIWADGDKVEVGCCKIEVTADVEGMGCVGAGYPIKHGAVAPAVARVGKLGLVEENYRRVMAAISEVEASNEWQAKIAAEKSNDRECTKNYENRIASGYCLKCGSYCYGDCSAN